MTVHERMMRLALVEAQKAFDEGEIPVGAVIAQGENVIACVNSARILQRMPKCWSFRLHPRYWGHVV